MSRRRYDLLRQDGAIWIDDWIGEDCISAAAMRRTLRQLADQDTIDVMVDSPGGCAREGLAIYVALRECRKPVNVVVVGLAGSMSAVVAMAGITIAIVETGRIFLHNSLAATDGRTISGRPYLNASELRLRATQCDRDDAVHRDIICGRTGLPPERIRLLCDAETTLSAPEAVQLGFADRIISVDQLAGHRAMRAVANVDEAEREPKRMMRRTAA